MPALPGCVTQGESYEEAPAHAKEAIEGYIETLIQLGKTVPVEPYRPETVAMDVEVDLPSAA